MKENLRKIREQDPGASIKVMYNNIPGHWSVRVPLTDLKIDQISRDKSISKIKLIYSDGREYIYENPRNKRQDNGNN